MQAKSKKSKKIIIGISIVLGIVAIVLIVFGIYYNHVKYQSELQKKASNQNNVIIATGRAVEFMQFMDKESIEKDKTVYDRYKKASEKIFENIYEKNLNVYQFSYLSMLNSYFKLGKDDYIKSLFDKFYSEEYHLLKPEIDTSEEDMDELSLVSDNLFPLVVLNRSGFDYSEYKIDDQLITLYNKYTDSNPIQEENEKIDNGASSIFFYFNYINKLEKIDYNKMKDYFIRDTLYDITDKNESMYGYFSDVSSVNFYLHIFNNDYSYQDKANKAYFELNSDEDFDYYGSSDNFTVILHKIGYSFIDCINENQYLVKNVNRWLNETYDKEIKENGHEWLGEL